MSCAEFWEHEHAVHLEQALMGAHTESPLDQKEFSLISLKMTHVEVDAILNGLHHIATRLKGYVSLSCC